MKYWNKYSKGKINLISDHGHDLEDRILSIKVDDGNVRFREECDQYFELELSKGDAVKALNEAISFIQESRDKNDTELLKEFNNLNIEGDFK